MNENNIDWNKIREECPLAWLKLEKYFCKGSLRQLMIDELGYFLCRYKEDLEKDITLFNDRDLYDFFDSVKILVTIHTYLYFGRFFGAHIYVTDINSREPTEIISAMKTRTEAEVQAFTRAFYHYEEQLKTA